MIAIAFNTDIFVLKARRFDLKTAFNSQITGKKIEP